MAKENKIQYLVKALFRQSVLAALGLAGGVTMSFPVNAKISDHSSTDTKSVEERLAKIRETVSTFHIEDVTSELTKQDQVKVAQWYSQWYNPWFNPWASWGKPWFSQWASY